MPKLIFINNTQKAQHTRQAIRRLVGKAVSPHLRRWKLHDHTRLEIGPAEIAALRLLVESAYQRRTPPARRCWIVRAQLEIGQMSLWAEMAGPSDIADEEEAYQLVDQLMQPEIGWQVEDIERHELSQKPALPFTTSTLLQSASKDLGFLPGRSEQAAQALYKARLITHPHSASAAVSARAQAVARRVIGSLHGSTYLPDAPATGEADIDQAILPTNIPLHPDLLGTGEFASPELGKDARRLYALIWQRFIASQMAPARCQVITAAIRPTWTGCVEPWEEPGTYSHPFVFQARGRLVTFDGYLRVCPKAGDENEALALATLGKGAELRIDQISAGPRPTTALERYSIAELIAELEDARIGRPETYAAIVESLLELGYLRHEKGQLIPIRLGEDVLFVCLQHFPEVCSTRFAAALEEGLDQVAAGKGDRRAVIDAVYAQLIAQEEPPAAREFPFPDHPKEMVS